MGSLSATLSGLVGVNQLAQGEPEVAEHLAVTVAGVPAD